MPASRRWPAGEVGSKGVELDVSGEILPNLRLSAACAYTDATVTKGDNTIVTGSRFPDVARRRATSPRLRIRRPG